MFYQYNPWSRQFDYYTAPIQNVELRIPDWPHQCIPWQAIETIHPQEPQYYGSGAVPVGFVLTGQQIQPGALPAKCSSPETDLLWGFFGIVVGQFAYAALSRMLGLS